MGALFLLRTAIEFSGLQSLWVINMSAARWACFSLAAALAFGSGSSALGDEVYRWKDSSGKVHFGDRPPDATDPQAVKKVAVPSPNLAAGFKDTPADTADAPGKPKPEAEISAPALPKPIPKRGVAAQSKDSCEAKVAAFRASHACFAACGRPSGRARNNAGCEHCEEQPMPNC